MSFPLSSQAPAPTPLGHPALPLFQIDPNYLNFNHGSFGSTPRDVIAAQAKYRDLAEARPDPWFRVGYPVQ